MGARQELFDDWRTTDQYPKTSKSHTLPANSPLPKRQRLQEREHSACSQKPLSSNPAEVPSKPTQLDWRKPWINQNDLGHSLVNSHCQGVQPVFCNISDFAWASSMGTSRLIGSSPYLKSKGRDQRPRNIAGIRSRAWMPSIWETTFTSIPAR